MQTIKILIYAIIQGITEWLPISSTGHLILLDKFMPLGLSADFTEVFLVVIQAGSALAVVAMFLGTLWPFCKRANGGGEQHRKNTLTLWCKILIASIPAAIIGILVNDIIDETLYNIPVIAAALIVYGAVFILLEHHREKTQKNTPISGADTENTIISYKTAFIIGCFQTLALIPGTSRSGATILGGMVLGLSRPAAAGFSFFLAVPALAGASAVKLLSHDAAFSSSELYALALGVAASFAVSLAAMRLLLSFVKKHGFAAFGWYRIALGLLLAIYAAVSAQPSV